MLPWCRRPSWPAEFYEKKFEPPVIWVPGSYCRAQHFCPSVNVHQAGSRGGCASRPGSELDVAEATGRLSAIGAHQDTSAAAAASHDDDDDDDDDDDGRATSQPPDDPRARAGRVWCFSF